MHAQASSGSYNSAVCHCPYHPVLVKFNTKQYPVTRQAVRVLHGIVPDVCPFDILVRNSAGEGPIGQAASGNSHSRWVLICVHERMGENHTSKGRKRMTRGQV